MRWIRHTWRVHNYGVDYIFVDWKSAAQYFYSLIEERPETPEHYLYLVSTWAKPTHVYKDGKLDHV